MTATGTMVDFLVRYVEAEGALAESIPEGAWLMLPDELSRSLGVPEELGLTEDPEVGREEGFILLTAGDLLLRSTAETVLERGDAGCSYLGWPSGLPPTPAAMERQARDEIQPDHGRVDVTGAPDAMHLLVLRVGALITYSISIDEQVQEVEEAWVLAESGKPVPPPLKARLRCVATEPGSPPAVTRWAGDGVGAADLQLRARAERRCTELARQTSARLASQLAAVDDYYKRVLESVEERSARAAQDRLPLLAAQAAATRAEWNRRRAEVADDLTPTFEMRPFRMHLLAVPAYRINGAVRRGLRAYPLALTFVPLTSTFLPPGCPACGAEGQLVAGKDQLGCRRCLGSPAVPDGPSAGSTPVVSIAAGSTPDVSGPARAPGAQHGAAPGAGSKHRTAAGRGPRPAGRGAAMRPSGRATPKGSTSQSTLTQTGSRIVASFWQSVLSGERIRRRDVLASSPIAALIRLYGCRGPALVVGLRGDERPIHVHTSTFPGTDRRMWTAGELRTTAGRDVPFAVCWCSGTRTSLIELEAFPLADVGGFVTRSDELGKAYRRRFEVYLRPPPPPDEHLGASASALLDQAGRFAGLAYAARCLAAWWYLYGEPEDPTVLRVAEEPPVSTAAAVEAVVAKRLGWRVTTNSLAERYGCGLGDLRVEVRRVQDAVRQCPDTGW